MSNLREIIKEELARKGAIPFAHFMELALYCPNFGYYEQLDASPGQRGDFFTSVSVGPLFGELLAAQFTDWNQINARWQILEAGVHDGRLAADILKWSQANAPDSFKNLEYWILEPSAHRRKSQEKTLADFAGKVRWFTTWEELPKEGVHGAIFSNELLDAMPVHRLGWDAVQKKWFEWGVTLQGEEFTWTRLEFNHQNLLSQIGLEKKSMPLELLSVLPDGFTTEICPAAIKWWRNAARALKSGKLLAFDYGLSSEQFFTPERSEGTLRAYHQHHLSKDLLARPGEQDITSQVNFTAISTTGEAEGLQTETMNTQGQFLVGIVEKGGCGNPAVKEWTPSRVRQFQTLTHPEHLGRVFKVLVQTRNVPGN